jgi:drug/metabolite transporter (DMT)-like permease
MWQSLFAATILVFVGFLKTHTLPSFKKAGTRYLFCGIVGTAIPNYLFFTAIKHVEAGSMAVLFTLAPIFTYVFTLILGDEKIDGKRLTGILLGFSGAIIISAGGATEMFSLNKFYYIGLLCPLLYAAMSVYIGRHVLAPQHPLLMAGGTHLVSFAVLLPAALLTNQAHAIWITPTLPDGLILFHGVISATAYFLLFKIIDLEGPVFYSFSSYIIAITGVTWGMLIFDERYTLDFLFATLLVFGGLYLVNSTKRLNVRKA